MTLVNLCIVLNFVIFSVHITEFEANDASANIIVRGAQQITKPTRWILIVCVCVGYNIAAHIVAYCCS